MMKLRAILVSSPSSSGLTLISLYAHFTPGVDADSRSTLDYDGLSRAKATVLSYIDTEFENVSI